jgi:hypothetical protein
LAILPSFGGLVVVMATITGLLSGAVIVCPQTTAENRPERIEEMGQPQRGGTG